MRGVILAGGLGTRLKPLTNLTNKHLLPVYDKQMIIYPIETMVLAGITDILIVTGGEHAGDFIKLLSNGEDYKCNIRYAYQRGEGGIADALKLAEDFSKHEPFVTVLGDNFFEQNLAEYVQAFLKQHGGARVLLKKMSFEEAKRFGCAKIKDDRVEKLIEKPKEPVSDLVVTGCYMFDYRVWWYMDRIRPSDRGELEVTDLLNHYIDASHLEYDILDGYWSDMGTHESLIKTASHIHSRSHLQRRI